MAELTVDMIYGKALYEAATDMNKTDLILEEAQSLVEIFKNEPEFLEFISTPVISVAKKKKAISSVFIGKISNELINLLFVLIDKGRTRHFGAIIRRYKLLIDENHGFSTGTIFSVKPLSKEQIVSFEDKTGKLIQKKVKLENKTDSTLLGGVRIFIEGKVIDATIRKRLIDLNESLR